MMANFLFDSFMMSARAQNFCACSACAEMNMILILGAVIMASIIFIALPEENRIKPPATSRFSLWIHP